MVSLLRGVVYGDANGNRDPDGHTNGPDGDANDILHGNGDDHAEQYGYGDEHRDHSADGDSDKHSGTEPDPNGDASLVLAQDDVLAMQTVAGDAICLRLTAAGSSGTLSCNGGMGHDVTVTSDAGEFADPPLTQAFLGADSGPGAATLLVSTEIAQLPAGASLAECLTTAPYGAPQIRAFSTAISPPHQQDDFGRFCLDSLYLSFDTASPVVGFVVQGQFDGGEGIGGCCSPAGTG